MDQKAKQRERARDAYRDTMTDIASLVADAGKDPRAEEERLREPISWTERTEINIMLSWGGPSDGFKLYREEDGEIAEGYYYFSDWFTYDEFRLSKAELDQVLAIYPAE